MCCASGMALRTRAVCSLSDVATSEDPSTFCFKPDGFGNVLIEASIRNRAGEICAICGSEVRNHASRLVGETPRHSPKARARAHMIKRAKVLPLNFRILKSAARTGRVK